MSTSPQQIHPDIPVDRAWRVGRRIYIRTGKTSQLNQKLIALGAKFDWDVKARWVGSGKAEKVIPLILDHIGVIAKLEAIKAGGRWVTVPRGAESIHTLARQLHAVWDKPTGRYAMPDDDALAAITAAITEWQAAKKRERDELASRRDEMQRQTPSVKVTTRDVRDREIKEAAAAAGRVVTLEHGEATMRIAGKMSRAAAAQRAVQPGEVVVIGHPDDRDDPSADVRRGLVLSTELWFLSQDAIDDGLASPEEDPGWRCSIRYVVVEPTGSELEADRRERAEREDYEEIGNVMYAVARVQLEGVNVLDRLDGPSITADSPGAMSIHGGKVTVTADGVWYQHPGFYDSWLPGQVAITDPDLVARIHAVIAAGPRRQGQYVVAD